MSKSNLFVHPKLPWLVVAGGILFTLGLQLYARNGVLFSGDGGLKALLAQQFAAGNWHFDLRLSVPAWVVRLWQQGLYPFTPPYVYERSEQYFVTFPFPFPALSAPFYRVLGYRGLYVVPLIALWLIWFRFLQMGQQLRWSANALAIALCTLIFASPLTLYGAMYWEHTLAACLVFWGLTLVLWPDKTSVSSVQALVAGSLIGFSIWFRSEFICLAAILIGLALLQWLGPKVLSWLPTLQGQIPLFIGGLLVTIAIFFGLNQIIYGHFLGIHALQVVEESSISQQLTQAMANYKQLFNALIRYFPFTLWVLAMTVMAGSNRTRRQIATAWLILLLFMLAVPLIIPPGAGGKQWGARFYLIVVPMLTLIGGIYLNQTLTASRRRWQRYLVLGSLTAVLLVGTYVNVYQGAIASYRDRTTNSTSLRHNYEPIAPAIAAINEHPSVYIAMSHQFVAQQLWAATPKKTFFLTESSAAVEILADGLYQQGYDEFLYICYPHRPCSTPEEVGKNGPVFSEQPPLRLQFSSIGTFGKYPLYDVKITDQTDSGPKPTTVSVNTPRQPRTLF